MRKGLELRLLNLHPPTAGTSEKDFEILLKDPLVKSDIINPRRACAARVTVVVLCVCLSVCLSIYDYSRTTGYEAAYERYQQIQYYKGRKNNVAILLKRLRSRDMA